MWDTSSETLKFHSKGGDGGKIEKYGRNESSSVDVESVDAATIVSKYENSDMLKIDIEGAERIVMPRLKPHLSRVTNLFVEYHCEEGERQNLSEIIKIMDEAGFGVFIHTEHVSR